MKFPPRPNYLKELLIRGLDMGEAMMTVEAIHSCAIEGIKKPETKEDFDSLAKGVLEMRRGK